ncbi:MAG: hypothetical protein ABEJ28_01550, partial [Salinigranum sp.]
MDWTRRRLLGACVALAGSGTAGCLAGGSNVRYPRTPGGNDSARRPLVEATPGSNSGSGKRDSRSSDPSPPPNQALAARTDRIYVELRWFATEYDAAISAYRKAVEKAGKRLGQIRAADGFDATALDRVRAAVSDVESETKDAVGPHFAADELVAQEMDLHLRTVEKFARRRDVDRVKEELGLAVDFLQSVASEEFVQTRMPRHPVQNRLFRWMQKTPKRPVLFELFYRGPKAGVNHDVTFAAYAYAGDQRHLLSTPVAADRRRRHDAVFGVLSRPDERTDHAYVVPRPLPTKKPLPPQPPRDATTLPSMPVYLQRFPDVESANAVRESLLGGGALTQEGFFKFGSDPWRRVYYRFEGDVWYAYLIQAGRYLLATAPSRTAWEERVDWTEPLRRTWLWPSGPESETPTNDLASPTDGSARPLPPRGR